MFPPNYGLVSSLRTRSGCLGWCNQLVAGTVALLCPFWQTFHFWSLLDASQSADQRTQHNSAIQRHAENKDVCVLGRLRHSQRPLDIPWGVPDGFQITDLLGPPVGASWSSKFFSLLCWWGPSNQYGPQSFWMDLTIGERSRNSIKLREMANKTHLTSWRRKEHHGPSAGLWITYTYLCIYIYK